MPDRPQFYDTTDAARALGCEPWQIAALYHRELVPEPPRVGPVRVLTPADLPVLRAALEKAGYLKRRVSWSGGQGMRMRPAAALVPILWVWFSGALGLVGLSHVDPVGKDMPMPGFTGF
jgi:hypothetical protein